MKAHNFFAETKVEGKIREEMDKYNHLVGKKIKAKPTNECPEDKALEEETFSVVGLTTKQYTTKIHAVLKSDECDVAVIVDVDYIGRERKDYSYNPGYILELLE